MGGERNNEGEKRGGEEDEEEGKGWKRENERSEEKEKETGKAYNHLSTTVVYR